MDVIYRNFDGLEVAFATHIPESMAVVLQEAKERASTEMRPVTIEYGGVAMQVAETGAKGGYAFRCDTGRDGATWFFKNPSGRDPWGVRVSVKSLALALYQLGGVKTHLHDFLEAIGAPVAANGVSIGRIDYAVDVLAPDFELQPGHFVMHWRCKRRSKPDVDEDGTSGRYTGIRIGSMPGRQVAVYDKRAEVIEKQKVEWWEIWNDARRKGGQPELNRRDPQRSRVWRFEFRAGKTELKDHWGITTWADLHDKVGDSLQRLASEISLRSPTSDANRSRWPIASIWQTVQEELRSDLLEMISEVDPDPVKQVVREHLREMVLCQIEGLAALWTVVSDIQAEKPALVAQRLGEAIRRRIEAAPEQFDQKLERATGRYRFL